MKKIIIPVSIFFYFFFCNCKKEYVCECTNPGGKFIAFSKRCSKSQAKQKCDDYYNSNYGNIPMSETYCEVK